MSSNGHGLSRIAHLRVRHLELVSLIDQLGGVREAAERLNRSQPAATRMLQEVEAAFGTNVFDRTSRGLKPTPLGAAVVRYARLALADMGAAMAELDGSRSSGTALLRIGVISMSMVEVVPRAAGLLNLRWPGATIHFSEDTPDGLMRRLEGGKLHCIVSRFPATSTAHPNLVRKRLLDASLVVAASLSSPLAGQCVDWQTLAEQPWMFPSVGTDLRALVEDAFATHRCPCPRPRVEAATTFSMITLMQHTNLVGVLPDNVARLAESANLLRRLTVVDPPALLKPLEVIYRHDRGASELRDGFVAILEEVAQQMQPSR